jgi:hypothetical protein
MNAQSLQYWFRKRPVPATIQIFQGDKVSEYVKTEDQNWADVARSIVAMDPDKVEVYDAKGKVLRAVRFDDDEVEEQAAKAAAAKAPSYDAETERMRVFATLLAEAYKFSTTVAFEKMASLFDAVYRQGESQSKALYEMNRLLGKAYQEQVEMALEHAETAGETDPVTGLIGTFLTGQQQGAAAAAANKANGAKAPANGKGSQI